jgi:hypothetical protein
VKGWEEKDGKHTFVTQIKKSRPLDFVGARLLYLLVVLLLSIFGHGIGLE